MEEKLIVLTESQFENFKVDLANSVFVLFNELIDQFDSGVKGKKWLSNDETMEYLGVSGTTLWRYRRNGLKCSQKAGKVFFSVDDLNKWLQND